MGPTLTPAALTLPPTISVPVPLVFRPPADPAVPDSQRGIRSHSR